MDDEQFWRIVIGGAILGALMTLRAIWKDRKRRPDPKDPRE